MGKGMIMKQIAKDSAVKKKYEKPLLRVVNIADSAQTLGIGCKTTSNVDIRPGTTPCAPVTGTPCFQPGS